MAARIIFTEEFCQPENLYPFTLTRPIQDIRIGILTIREKWEQSLGMESFDKNEDDYKNLEHSITIDKKLEEGVYFLIHGNILPTPKLVKKIKQLKNGECISIADQSAVIFRFTKNEISGDNKIKISKAIHLRDVVRCVQFPWQIFELNDYAIREDFLLITRKRKSQNIPKHVKRVSASNIFLEKGVVLEHCILNASEGPIYIGKNAVIMDGAILRGPVSIGGEAVVKMGAKIYGATTIGPKCIVGGEIKNSVFGDYSNKAHDGYVGNSVIGAFCNLGAGTSNSNLKNNASTIKVKMPKSTINVGLKCGFFMGDYSRTAINTSINTGTVVGVCCNIFETGLTPKYIPSFSWGKEKRYKLLKSFEDIDAWKKLKNLSLEQKEKAILKYIFDNF